VILFRPAAARELAADVRYYDDHYAGRGQRFAQAVERTFALSVEFRGRRDLLRVSLPRS